MGAKHISYSVLTAAGSIDTQTAGKGVMWQVICTLLSGILALVIAGFWRLADKNPHAYKRLVLMLTIALVAVWALGAVWVAACWVTYSECAPLLKDGALKAARSAFEAPLSIFLWYSLVLGVLQGYFQCLRFLPRWLADLPKERD